MDCHLELIVDKWPIGPQTRVRSRGDRFTIDSEAARILVGMGKARYVDRSVIAGEDNAPPPRTKRKYARRDMQASGD